MDRLHTTHEKFKLHFPNPHSIVVAIHAKSIAHALEQSEIALQNGADWIAVVTHDISPSEWFESLVAVKEKFPYHKAILNILDWKFDPETIFSTMYEKNLLKKIDGIRADCAYMPWVDWIERDERCIARNTKNIQVENSYPGLYFWWLNFKGQIEIPNEELWVATSIAKKFIDVITTSWPGTWKSADPKQIAFMKSIIWDYPFAIASGVTAENFHEFAPHLDLTFVNTWVSKDIQIGSITKKDFYHLDPELVAKLMSKRDKYNTGILKKEFWEYLLRKYNTDSYLNLQNIIKTTWIINMWYWHEQEIEKMLSNMCPSPFVLDWVTYASVESFWMSIKYPQSDEKHFIARDLVGKEAKKAWDAAKYYKSIQYNGHIILMWSPEHHALMKRAIRAKLEQNHEIAKALKESWDRPIIHILFDKDMQWVHADSKTIPWEVFAKIVTDLRTELQQA